MITVYNIVHFTYDVMMYESVSCVVICVGVMMNVVICVCVGVVMRMTCVGIVMNVHRVL